MGVGAAPPGRHNARFAGLVESAQKNTYRKVRVISEVPEVSVHYEELRADVSGGAVCSVSGV